MSRARLLDVTLCCVLQVLLVEFSTAQFTQKVGDSWQLLSGGPGVCIEFDDCELSLLANEPAQPAICAWLNGDAIVCCPTPNNEISRPPQPPTVGGWRSKSSQKVGDSCQLLSGGPGVCIEFDDCELSLLANEPAHPAICAWLNGDAIVCCPTPNNEISRPPQTPTVGGRRSKSSQKCDEYKSRKTTTIVHTILGGTNVPSVTQYPHVALLGYGNPPTWQCGGTLISEQFIVTAAHCLNGNDLSPVTTAHLGFVDKRNRNAFGTLQEFKIIQTFKHPTRKPPTVYADIALLKLDKPVKFTKGVLPACLYEDFDFPVKNARAIGWGGLTLNSNVGSDILQEVTLSLRSDEECTSNYPIEKKLPQGLQSDTQFCAGDKGKDTCQSDSGGPLLIHDPSGMAKIIGITSFGQECGKQPGVYTRISHYVSWIESIVWPN